MVGFFSIFGLYDYLKIEKNTIFENALTKTVDSLATMLKDYDCGYWSKYDNNNKITSPFYHDLHIELLKVMFDLFRYEEFKYYYEKWAEYRNRFINRSRAFIKKAFQKLFFDKKSNFIVK